MKKAYCIILIFVFLFINCCIAQQPDIVFHHITEKEGLSYNIINSFLKDSRGILWIGTYNGLNKYDGAHFFTYHSGHAKNTLPNNTVHDLAEDKKGNIWGATGKGVFCLNANTGHFKNYTLLNKLGWVSNIFCDKDGIIWATNTFNLSFFNTATDSFQLAPTKEKYKENQIGKNGMAASPDGNSIWLATRQGLQCYDKKSARFISSDNNNDSSLFKKNDASALCKTSYGHYWYVDNKTKTIIGFEPATKKVKYNINAKELEKMSFAATLFEDNNHILWLCTWNYELFMIDYLHGNTVTRVRHNKNDLSSVAGDFFWDAMQETDGTLWLGTVGGISKSNPSHSFYKVHHLPEHVKTKENPAVNFVTENPLDKTWWIATTKQVLVHYNPTTSRTDTYELGKFIPDKSSKTPTQVYKIIFLKDSMLLFSHNGAWIKKKGENNFSPLLLSAPFNNWLLRDAVLYKQNILYCTSIEKLLRWDLQTGKQDSLAYVKPFIIEGNGLYLGAPCVDSTGKVWMLNGSNWLTYTDGSELKPLKMKYQDSIEMNDGYFWAMTMDRNSDLWMSKKGDGLIYYSPAKNISKQFKQQDGLVMDHIMAVAKDGDNKIWSACYNQFSVYNPMLNSFYNFTLPISANNYAYVNIMAPLQNGNIIASIAGDVVEFFTAKLKPPQVKDKPLISMLYINGADYNFYSSKVLQLAPDENSLRIKFGMLTDNVATPYEMLYMLDDAEKNWSIASINFEASYNSLPPGNYIFKVKALAKDKSWESEETVLAIHIATPFYKAWWFLLLLALATLAAIVIVYRLRLAQNERVLLLENKAQLLEKEKVMVMYESLKQQLNPHFLFNSLTSLSGLIETDKYVAGNFLEQMSGIYRYILQNNDNETVLLKDEMEFVKLYINLQQTRFKKGLQVNINVPEDYLHYKIAPVTLQNLIENAIKHNIIDASSPLVIDIFIEGDYVVVKNNLQKKNVVETSNKKGLAQFTSLYHYLSELPVVIEETEKMFKIKIPLI